MRRIEGTRKQHIALNFAVLVLIAAYFWLAMSGKALGLVLFLAASVTILAMAITRLEVLVKVALVLTVLFGASFLVPVEIAVERGHGFGVHWVPCLWVSGFSSVIKQTTGPDEPYVIVRGCIPILGVEPTRVVKVNIP